MFGSRTVAKKKLRYEVKQLDSRYEVDSSMNGGFIWWNKENAALQNTEFGWELHEGFNIDIKITGQGTLYLDIDSYYRLYSPWNLTEWFTKHPDLSLSCFPYVRNIYDAMTWKKLCFDPRRPEEVTFAENGQTLADFHLRHKKAPATPKEIQSSFVIQVQGTTKQLKNKLVFHLSSRVRPCVSLDLLATLADNGDQTVNQVFNTIKPTVQERFSQSKHIAQLIGHQIYQLAKDDAYQISPFSLEGETVQIHNTSLISYNHEPINKVYQSLSQGFFKSGETRLGYLNYENNSANLGWSKFILRQIENLARVHQVEIDTSSIRHKEQIPNSSIQRFQFWKSWRDEGIQTILVVCNWLENEEKLTLTKEALEHGIALQFMLPVKEKVVKIQQKNGTYKEDIRLNNPNDRYRIQNILLGLFAKAGWQAVGLNSELISNFADLVIGFDAGRNDTLSYGTSSFAVLASGQTLGWELPEAQKAEKLNHEHVKLSVRKIIGQFQNLMNGELPKRILLMRDGLIQANEFDSLLSELKEERIAYDLISVRKSGAGRMAQLQLRDENQPTYIDVPRGTVVFSGEHKLKIVTSEAKAGGSARPLSIIREAGSTPIKDIAEQVFVLTLLHPTSAAFPSRLPMPLHYADKLAKKVQSLGSVGILQSLSRQKLFFV
ncbi:argonaute PAZ domain-containing protein [Picosynechococcus sp. NKBG042902]|uniref:argonaute PAZ domain-containing protein n=1 Tax=Picosynechococcus sp. NKBG042902 TaxID=490193 RepID=UPI0004ABC055|nr:argonaute PAZ domain-containing protein [Picosynechococcus sp. NKBG042902]